MYIYFFQEEYAYLGLQPAPSLPPVHIQLVAALFKPPGHVLLMVGSCHMDPKQGLLGQATKAV